MTKIAVNKGGSADIFVDTKLYSLDVIYTATYVFLDKCYILLDSNPEGEIIINITPKGGKNVESIAKEFCNELINYSFYKSQAEKSYKIRETIMQAALLPMLSESKKETEKVQEIPEAEYDNADFLEDPEGIAIPWEEKYGKKRRKKC